MIDITETPNPESKKFIFSFPIVKTGSKEIKSLSECENINFAKKLFETNLIELIFIDSNFITIKKLSDKSWDEVSTIALQILSTEIKEDFIPLSFEKISNFKIDRNLNQGEKINLQNLGKSAYVNKNIEKNKIIRPSDIFFSSPKVGLDNHELKKFLKIRNKNLLKKGDPITINNFKLQKKFSTKSKFFCDRKKLSLPIRHTDCLLINNNFNSFCLFL